MREERHAPTVICALKDNQLIDDADLETCQVTIMQLSCYLTSNQIQCKHHITGTIISDAACPHLVALFISSHVKQHDVISGL